MQLRYAQYHGRGVTESVQSSVNAPYEENEIMLHRMALTHLSVM